MNTFTLTSRELIGEAHSRSQLYRQYSFPVLVYKINEDGSRDLVRIEDSSR